MSGNKVLELKNISKSFGTRKIIDKLNLSLDQGDILSIIGPSGAGKTTLLRLIAGLESADSGKFLHNGKEFDPKMFPIGTRLRILPNHACPTGAQHPCYYVVNNSLEIKDKWSRFYGW